MTAIDALKMVINKCDLLFDGEVISKELLMQKLADFLLQTTEKEKHNVGFILHTGSICYSVIAVAYAAVSCLVYNENDVASVIYSLQDGDYVLFRGQRCIFKGFSNGCNPNQQKNYIPVKKIETHDSNTDFIMLYNNKDTFYIRRNSWHSIQPYLGESQKLDGRGVRKSGSIRNEFYSDVLEYNTTDIPNVINVSVVLVLSRAMADSLIKRISLRFNEKTIRLLDLVTASYYTENDNYNYGGNVAKTEPLLKITGKVSVARQLVLSREGNKHIGLMVFGNDMVTKNRTELPELLNRQSLRYIYVLSNNDSQESVSVIKEVEHSNVFVCSKEFLLNNSLPCNLKNKYTIELDKQVSTVINKTILHQVVQGWVSWKDYIGFTHCIKAIQNSDYSTDEVYDFIIYSRFLMKTFLTIPVTIQEREKSVSSGALSALPIGQTLQEIKKAYTTFPDYLQEKARSILSILELSYLRLSEKSEKGEYIRRILKENRNKHIAIVVPKSNYSTIMRDYGYYDMMDDKSLLTIVTANSFDNSVIYDRIIVLGNYNGKRFNAFKSLASPVIETVLYSFEVNYYNYRKKCALMEELELSGLDTSLTVNHDDQVIDDMICVDEKEEVEIEEFAQMETSIDDYIRRISETISFREIETYAQARGGHTAEVVAVGTFENGEKVFFTKNYLAYVIDENEGVVKETGVSQLSDGDLLVFTYNTLETRDIVDSIMSKLIDEHRINDDLVDCLEKSKKWKNVLIEYMQTHKIPAKRIAELMVKNGASVQEVTICRWLDEDSHMVGPQKVDSIKQIAVLVGDEEMLSNANDYFEACTRIRKLRRLILKWIGKAIVEKLSGCKPKEKVMAEIYERLDSIAQVLRLESVVPVERTIPMHFINRPFNL